MFNNFVYQNPVKILFGKGQIAQLGRLSKEHKKILSYFCSAKTKIKKELDVQRTP